MVLFFLTTLGVSVTGLLALILLKQWELSTGKMLAGSLRPAMHAFFHNVLVWFETVLPALLRERTSTLGKNLLAVVHRTTALLVLLTERLLERTLRFVHRSTDVRHRAAGEASAFLREVAEHKRKLLRSERTQVWLHKE